MNFEPPNRQYGDQDEGRSAHERHLERMLSYYASTAGDYNRWHWDRTGGSFHDYAVDEVISVLRTTGSNTLLDVCCGTGRAVKAAIDNGYQATGVDISDELLSIGKKELGIPEKTLVQADATRLPFPDESFDIACILGALHHTAMPRLIISEMIRVSRVGLVISDEANGLSGGIKKLLVRLGVFKPIYRLIFRREPRQHRREFELPGDGPRFAFTIEEVLPLLKSEFLKFKCLTFYSLRRRQIHSYYLPRLFAKHGIVTVWNKTQKKRSP